MEWKSNIIDIKYDKEGNFLSYRNDNRIRQAEQEIALKAEHVEEIIKCKNNVCYFLEHYCYFNHPEKGLCIVELYDWQKDLLKHIQKNKFSALLLPRQAGKSTTMAFFLTWFICFHNDRTSGIVANKFDVAKEIFERVKLSFRYLPHFLKPGIESIMKTKLELDNGSKLITGATSEAGLSGYTINGLLLMDEVAKINTYLFESFYSSMEPTIARAQQSKLVMISSPFGMNHWYKIWTKANQNENNYKPFTIKWNQVPGRDEEWRKQKIKDVGPEIFAQEYDCKFVAAANSLFSAEIMEKLKTKDPIARSYNFHLKIYEQPIEKHEYIICCDPSEGTGKDNAVINVIDVSNSKNFKQVATYYDNKTEPTLYPILVSQIASKYNNGYVIVENNNVGHLILHILQNEIEYDNIFNEGTKELGIRMTRTIKNSGCARLKELVENGALEINDFDTFSEMSTFIYKRGFYQAMPGSYDDSVMSLVLFGYFTTTSFFKEIIDNYEFMDGILNDKLKDIKDAEEIAYAKENFEIISSDDNNEEDEFVELASLM